MPSTDEHDEVTSPSLGPGRSVGRYLLQRKVGAGGMGVVYQAWDPLLQRSVALKLLRARGSNADVSSARLLREAKAMARLSHPHVVPVHDVGTEGDAVFIAMDFAGGGTLSDWMQEGGAPTNPARGVAGAFALQKPRPWAQVLDRFLPAGRGLLAAHDAGLVHRDFKPANVLIADDGRVLVTDFGIARDSGGERLEPGAADAPAGVARRDLTGIETETGTVLGSPGYMAPEQMAGDRVAASADVFAFCVSLWRALYGEAPFTGRSLFELRGAIVAGLLRQPPADSDVPAWLPKLLEQGLRADPEARPSLRELLGEIERQRALRELSRLEQALQEAQALARQDGASAPTSQLALSLLQEFVGRPAIADEPAAPASDDLEIRGTHLAGMMERVGNLHTLVSHFCLREGVGELGPDGVVRFTAQWYPSGPLVRAIHRFTERVGPRAAFEIGFASQAAAGALPEGGLPQALSRAGSIWSGVYRRSAPGVPAEILFDVAPAGPRAARVLRGGRWPCDFDRGVLTGLALRLNPTALVTHLADGPCKKKGDARCGFLVTWGAPLEAAAIRRAQGGVRGERLREAVSLDEFLFEPYGRFIRGQGLLYWCLDPQLDGCMLWGSPTVADVRTLARAGAAMNLAAGPRVSMLDLRHVREVRPDTYQAMAEYLRRAGPQLARRLRAQALVRPPGMAGALITGHFDLEPPAHPFKIFADAEAAMAWLGRAEPELLAALEAIVEDK